MQSHGKSYIQKVIMGAIRGDFPHVEFQMSVPKLGLEYVRVFEQLMSTKY